MITFYVPFLWQKLIYSREVRHFFPFLNPELWVKTLAQELALKISWSTKSNSIECDSSHLYLKRRWRKSALNEYQENLCVIFEEEFILVQKFLKIAFYIWKTKWKWLVALLSQTRRPGAVRLSFALFSLIIDGVLFDQIYVTDLNLKLKLHIHLQFTHPKELIFWNNKRYFMAIFLSHLK